ncbi:helix-turn-helix domain-containing protein [Nanoarchaeota archaeon]
MQANNAYKLEGGRAKDQSSPYSRAAQERNNLTYRIQNEIEQEIPVPFKEVSQGLAKNLTDTAYQLSAEQGHYNRKNSLDFFDKQFLERESEKVDGSMRDFVRNAYGVEDDKTVDNISRNWFRKKERFDLADKIDSMRIINKDPWAEPVLEDKVYSAPQPVVEKVESALYSTLSNYKDAIHPKMYDDLSSKIKEKAPLLAEKLSEYMPTPANRLRGLMESTTGISRYNEAREMFERQVVYDALEAAKWDKEKASQYLGDSLRTLNRRISELGIERDVKDGAEDGKVVRIEDFVRKKEKDTGGKPDGAVDEIERFRQLVQEYNAKRDVDRVRKTVKKNADKENLRLAA